MRLQSRALSLRQVLNRVLGEPLPETLRKAFDDACKALARELGK